MVSLFLISQVIGGSGTTTVIQGVEYGWEKVDEVLVDSDRDYIDFNDLDFNRDWFYMLWLALKPPPGDIGSGYQLFVNNDLTKTNYYCQYLYSSGTSIVAERRNAPDLCGATANDRTFTTCFMGMDPDGYFRYLSFVNRHTATTQELLVRAGSYTISLSNISTIRIAATQSNGIGAGSKVALFRCKRT